MKKILLLIVSLALVTTSCEFIPNGIKGNGNVVKKEVNIQNFTAVNVSNGFDLYLAHGEAPGLILEADENLLPHIKTKVENGRLIISSRKNIWKSKSLKARVTYTSLERIEASGGSDIYSTDKIKAPEFAMQMSGGSDAELEVESDEAKLELSGGSDIDLSFSGNHIHISASGGSDSELSLHSLTKAIIQISGGADAVVIGTSEMLSLNCSGGSDFKGRGFKVQKATVSASGASDAHLHVIKEISVSASGASSVRSEGGASVISQDISKTASFHLH